MAGHVRRKCDETLRVLYPNKTHILQRTRNHIRVMCDLGPCERNGECENVMSNQVLGYVGVFLAAFFFGSNFIVLKKYKTGDGMFFQVPFCLGIWYVDRSIENSRRKTEGRSYSFRNLPQVYRRVRDVGPTDASEILSAGYVGWFDMGDGECSFHTHYSTHRNGNGVDRVGDIRFGDRVVYRLFRVVWTEIGKERHSRPSALDRRTLHRVILVGGGVSSQEDDIRRGQKTRRERAQLARRTSR